MVKINSLCVPRYVLRDVKVKSVGKLNGLLVLFS